MAHSALVQSDLALGGSYDDVQCHAMLLHFRPIRVGGGWGGVCGGVESKISV